MNQPTDPRQSQFGGPSWPPPGPGQSGPGGQAPAGGTPQGGPRSWGAPGSGGGWRPPQRRGGGLGLVLLIVALILIGYALTRDGGSGLGGSRTATNDGKLTETVIDQPQSGGSYKIAVIDVNGVLIEGGDSFFFGLAPDPVGLVKRTIDRIDRDTAVKGLLMRVNSPGGGLTDSDVLFERLMAARQRWAQQGRQVAVYVLMGDVAASGAYYLAAAADHIMAHPTTVTGSIGVIMAGWNYSGLMEKLGIRDATITSVDNKDMGSPIAPPDPADEAYIRELLEQMHAQFVNQVLRGRQQVTPELTRDQVVAWADGSIYTASDALDRGMIDSIGYEDKVLGMMQAAINPNEAPLVVQYAKPASFPLGLPFGMAEGGGGVPMASSDPAVQVSQWIRRLGALAQQRPDAQLPRVWAIWPGMR